MRQHNKTRRHRSSPHRPRRGHSLA